MFEELIERLSDAVRTNEKDRLKLDEAVDQVNISDQECLQIKKDLLEAIQSKSLKETQDA